MAGCVLERCSFFVQKKNRFCKMIVGKEKRFCGEHAVEEGNSRRIVCPLDPKHTVNADDLEKHLKKCNAREKPKPVYYTENINAGSSDEDESIQQVCLSERSGADLHSLLAKLEAAASGSAWELQDSFLSHPVLQDELADPKKGDSALKHLKQQSSILGHLEALQLLAGRRCFVEFGAGRGKLSHWIHGALKNCEEVHLLLVERSTTRFKVDGKHQDPGVQFERLHIDIQHLDLSKVPLLSQKTIPLVGIGKHLCGAATDLALRCLLETPGGSTAEPPHKLLKISPPTPQGSSAAPGSSAVPGPDRSGPSVLGLVVALCCHHRCEWRHYVGKEFFLQRGLGAAEFSAFCRMSSWATCGLRRANQAHPGQRPTNERDDDDHEAVGEPQSENLTSSLSAAERERVGRLCKRLIDGGRIDFLQKKGFDGRLIHYISNQVTLENVLLTAVPSRS
ncbi:tRNA:m(4)X modification enzyme TRM13 homolog isoform X2 [Thalassophryne amazonica]|uniref:tRNA:m(4)X modification enzyme TRM13 homolog isoform X2 n=1 Tax=Thalassophryne amazonica TaxID=390379 RepID=UPI001471DE84|nr:tRNA:m(4)X modification enzyme TRM13 homolog isoform X2 [Thalassophryne amazonica]